MSKATPPLGEFDLIARYFAPMAAPGALGLLDDAAAMTPPAGHDLVLTKDALISGIHFFADDPPDSVARKALRVNLSDLAAKGARPLGFLLGLGLPDWAKREDWLAEFARGLREDAAHFGCPLYGGDTVKTGDQLMISVTAIGAVPAGRMVRRGGGKAGDFLYVSGTVGDGALGLHQWMCQQSGEDYSVALAGRYLVPQPRLGLAPVLLAHANGAMDISDGLVGDATKLAAASGCGLVLRLGDVPLSGAARALIASHNPFFERAMTGGDDYEILCSVPGRNAPAFEAAAQTAGIAVTRIGELTAALNTRLIGPDGQPVGFQSGSYSHF